MKYIISLFVTLLLQPVHVYADTASVSTTENADVQPQSGVFKVAIRFNKSAEAAHPDVYAQQKISHLPFILNKTGKEDEYGMDIYIVSGAKKEGDAREVVDALMRHPFIADARVVH